ncbi:DEAD/DEAH box helicase [Fluviicola sp.]|uniref:DEAD/DEAH box helicase n=1 Tax=Fluviicola sp. TaxID=1917219 RepID=UPI0031E1F9E4
MTFHDLNIKKPILTALDELEYTTPTTIQSAGFSVMMSGKDVIGLAQTGTGKTLAYLLPMLSLWKFSKEPHPQILIIVPTRELVVQVVREVEKLTPYMNVVVGGVYGGANINTQAAMVLQGLDVLVGTPGRIFDLTANGSLQLKNVKKVVIDEVDETLNLGFRPQLMRIFELLPEKRQNLLFSATLSEEVETFLDNYFDNPIRVEAARAGTPLEKIKQDAISVPNFTSKVNLLKYLLEENKDMTKVLVFVSSRVLAEKLFDELEPLLQIELGIIHSQKAQNFRFNTVNHFENGIYRVLIATDLIARGIDVTDVTHVINFDIPDNVENYIHRIGRTGRQDKEGHAISFVSEKDKVFFGQIEAFMNKQVAITEFPEEVELSELVLEFEKPQVAMKNTLVKTPAKDEAGPAFHEKKAKNKKVNVRYNHKKAMQEKYGKPKKRGSKKK